MNDTEQVEHLKRTIRALQNSLDTKNKYIDILTEKINGSKAIKISAKLKGIKNIVSKPLILKRKYKSFQKRDRFQYWMKNKEKIQNRNFSGDLITVIIPVLNNPFNAVESIKSQFYKNWEIILVVDPNIPIDKNIQRTKNLKIIPSEKAKIDSKILDSINGKYTVLVFESDSLSPDALQEGAIAFANEDLDFIYSDEDKISSNGKRHSPIFKPDWSPDTILSTFYTTNLHFYRTEILKSIEISTDYELRNYDFILKYTERIDQKKIKHITKIFYHNYSNITSNFAVENFQLEVFKNIVTEAIQRRGIKAEVQEGLTINSFRIKRKIEGNPKINIIIPTKNRHDLVKVCIDSIIEKSTYKNYEIVLVDNNSDDPESIKYFESISNKVTLLKYPYPFNFSAINNFAVNKTKGEQILFLNNDTEVIAPGWLEALLEYSQLPEIGAVGAKLLYPNNTIQHAGVYMGLWGFAAHGFREFPTDNNGYMDRINISQDIAVNTGACLMVKRKLFDEVGQFNEYLAVAFNDVDLCLKLHDKGYRNIYTPFAKLYHYESISRGLDDTPEKMARNRVEADYMRENWMRYIEHDPYYNPNLTIKGENFGINVD